MAIKKDLLIKIGVALLVVAVIWFIVAGSKKVHKKRVIVTAMPKIPKGEMYDEMPEEVTEGYGDEDEVDEGYADWSGDAPETFDQYSSPQFNSDLLD